jgi:hypothetical protein
MKFPGGGDVSRKKLMSSFAVSLPAVVFLLRPCVSERSISLTRFDESDRPANDLGRLSCGVGVDLMVVVTGDAFWCSGGRPPSTVTMVFRRTRMPLFSVEDMLAELGAFALIPYFGYRQLFPLLVILYGTHSPVTVTRMDVGQLALEMVQGLYKYPSRS